MVAERMYNCWEVMQCDENSQCPVRINKISSCWEYMAQTNEFQCQYDLCHECIVYLCNDKNSLLTNVELENIMISRGLHQEDIKCSESNEALQQLAN